MTRILALIFAVGMLWSGPALAAPPPPGFYRVDPVHSNIGFEVAHLVISSVEGRFNEYQASVTVGKGGLHDMKVQAEMEVDSIDTGNADRDKDLRSANFFDVLKYPKMRFQSTKVSGTEKDLSVHGNLTIRGITKPVTLRGRYLGTVKDPQGKTRIAFAVATKIKRAEFGLTWNKVVEAGPVVGDEVTIDLKIQAVQEPPKSQAPGARNTS